MNVSHALAYARLGWHVLPLRPREKVPLHGQGLKHATRDETIIGRWFTNTPDAGIGIALAPSGLVAVDIDPRNGGDLELRDSLPPTLTATTGGGGLHLVYRVADDAHVLASMGAGVDIKHKGYIAVEPSIHPSGKGYSWLDFEPLEGEIPTIADAPQQLLKPAKPAPNTRPAPDAQIAEGGRNAALTRIAGQMRRNGLSADAIEAALQQVNTERCSPPLAEAEVCGIARSVGRYEPAPQRGEDHAVPRFKVFDAAALLKQEIKPVNYVVPGWIPEGLMLLVAPPKLGKSTLILQIAVCKAAGLPFWGSDVPEGKVLMIDLETNARRLRRKLEAAGVTALKPGQLLYATEWPRGIVGVDRIAQYLDADPGIVLVVIDTLQRFREVGKGGLNAYSADYEALAPLQQLCRERHGLAIVAVHHKRKAASDDPIDSINGSAAIAGAADGIWIIGRKGSDYTLNVQARDWEREQDEFRIERDAGQWRLVDGPRFTPNEAEVLKLLQVAGGMTGPQLGEALGVHRVSAHERLKRMEAAGLVAFRDGCWIHLI